MRPVIVQELRHRLTGERHEQGCSGRRLFGSHSGSRNPPKSTPRRILRIDLHCTCLLMASGYPEHDLGQEHGIKHVLLVDFAAGLRHCEVYFLAYCVWPSRLQLVEVLSDHSQHFRIIREILLLGIVALQVGKDETQVELEKLGHLSPVNGVDTFTLQVVRIVCAKQNRATGICRNFCSIEQKGWAGCHRKPEAIFRERKAARSHAVLCQQIVESVVIHGDRPVHERRHESSYWMVRRHLLSHRGDEKVRLLEMDIVQVIHQGDQSENGRAKSELSSLPPCVSRLCRHHLLNSILSQRALACIDDHHRLPVFVKIHVTTVSLEAFPHRKARQSVGLHNE
mmetsp:Transcript_69911/g.163537  ORF Transcript_69911/g.163537 Transcript_69911/m.163537 type:complete len:339 (-) Transcript_69911:143-1159(-)